MSGALEARHPDAVPQQNVIEQRVEAAERALARLAQVSFLQARAGFEESLIGDAVIAGEHPEVIDQGH